MSTENPLAPLAALTIPDSAALTTKAQTALAFIQAFEVDSPETYLLAADELKAIKTRTNTLEAQRTGITGPINAGLRAINDLFRGPADLLAQGERILKGKMLAWQQEQERIAAEQRRRAEEAAAAERRRLEEEAAARQREAEAQAAAAVAAAAAGDQAAAQASIAAAERATSEAAAATISAQVVVAPIVPVDKSTAKGISTAKKLDFEVFDLHALVKHIAAHTELLGLVTADNIRLRAYVNGVGLACALPGVRVFEKRVMSARVA